MFVVHIYTRHANLIGLFDKIMRLETYKRRDFNMFKHVYAAKKRNVVNTQ